MHRRLRIVLPAIASIRLPLAADSKKDGEGNTEKRVPTAIVVHFARAEDHTAEAPELTYTDNISAHGAGVISSRECKPGEIAEFTSLNDRVSLRGRVAYCAKSEEGRYYVGLYFNEQEVSWNPYVKYAGLQVGASLRERAAANPVRSA